jgi:hypothetical protein
MNKVYAGIGARVIPEEIRAKFWTIGNRMAYYGWTLRSGGAPGADSAFEAGCDVANGSKEIYLPWKGFNKSTSLLYLERPINPRLIAIAKQLYSRWDDGAEGTRKLHTRNVQQILGKEALNASEYSRFVCCYTDRSYKDVQAIGGTMFGIKLAEMHNIPVFNFFLEGEEEHFEEYLEQLIGSERQQPNP